MCRADLYDELLDGAISKATETAQRVVAEKTAAPDCLAELLALPAEERTPAVIREPRFQTYSMTVSLLARSETVIRHLPAAALELTRLARVSTIRIDPETCGGTAALADLGAYALASEGNALRVCGDMTAALTKLTRAREIQRYGGVDPLLAAQVDLMEASLRRDIGQLHAALSLLERSAETFLGLGECDLWSKAQINRSNVFQVEEEFEKAAIILEETFKEAKNPYTVLCIQHNLICILVQSGRPYEAARLLAKSRSLYHGFPDPLLTNRRLWVEGLIACGLGENKLARALLDKAGTDLDQRGYAFDAALARLDLGKLWNRGEAEPVC